ncbi:hypothetical protein HDE68_001054 [Pedobacter cryoconitis]|uniref:Uncharacterized protein n=1 Tax=Pedobacter cryoconitis TaxID=188932 RepID=A0A7W9DYG0_9SPHI|nr:hypothetical protein [Pedobacter cryoconitis]
MFAYVQVLFVSEHGFIFNELLISVLLVCLPLAWLFHNR